MRPLRASSSEVAAAPARRLSPSVSNARCEHVGIGRREVGRRDRVEVLARRRTAARLRSTGGSVAALDELATGTRRTAGRPASGTRSTAARAMRATRSGGRSARASRCRAAVGRRSRSPAAPRPTAPASAARSARSAPRARPRRTAFRRQRPRCDGGAGGRRGCGRAVGIHQRLHCCSASCHWCARSGQPESAEGCVVAIGASDARARRCRNVSLGDRPCRMPHCTRPRAACTSSSSAGCSSRSRWR